MARVNVSASQFSGKTHEGAPAYLIGPEQELRRSVMTCLLWEDTFYEGGDSIAKRIAELVPHVSPVKVSALAIEARSSMNLRHVPLFLVNEMVRHVEHRKLVRSTLSAVIQRADELAEFLAIYWKDGAGDRRKMKTKRPLAKSVQKGLADAFGKFGAYSLAKYNQDNPVKLRDVLFLSHAKAKDYEQQLLWKQLINNQLPTPDTWEVELSASKDKTASWTRLLEENKLGAMALLRNLRNMGEAKVDPALVKRALLAAKPDRLLPFRFITAARYAPAYIRELDDLMIRNVRSMERFPGTTFVLVDGSQSMELPVSAKSEVSRLDAAAGVAVIARELSGHCRIFVFSDRMKEAPAYTGLALADALKRQVPAVGTLLGAAVRELNKEHYDRLIVITDEQSQDKPPAPRGKGYVVNVNTYKKGVGYGPWTHIDGWSDKVLDYIRALEQEKEQ